MSASKVLFIFDPDNDRDTEIAIENKNVDELATIAKHGIRSVIDNYNNVRWHVQLPANARQTFGVTHPEITKTSAEEWNADLHDAVKDAYTKYIQATQMDIDRGTENGTDTCETMDLRLAACAIDNVFHPMCQMFICDIRRYEARTVLTNEMLAYILQNPQNCAVMTVYCSIYE